MKKRYLSLLIMLALLIAAVAFSAQAAEIPTDVQWIEIGSEADFNEWFSGGGSSKLLTDGYTKGMTRYIRLTDDVTVTTPGTYYLNAGNYQINVYWDLNGYTFTYKTPDTTGAARLFGAYNQNATATIVNGTIDNQSAITGSHGGMFTINKGHMVLEDVVIRDMGSHAYTAMGKVFSVNAGNTLTLTNVDFYLNNTNTAGTGKGGGIRCLGTLDMTDCNFISSATGKIEAGGILFLDGATATMTRCTFSGGTATTGAGIYASNSTITATGCSFSGGNAAKNGGCVYATGSTLTATNCTFTDGKAVTSGGNLYAISTTTELIGCTATVTYTSINDFGGNIYAQGNTTLLKDCTLTGGRASNGGIMYSVNGALTCDNTTFSGGYATTEGGNLMHKNGSLTLQNGTTLTGGSCKASGGNLSLSNTAKFYMDDTIRITGGSAKDGGNIHASLVEASSTAPVLNISGGEISGGTASNNGGNINLVGLSGKLVTLNLTGGTVSGGTAAVGGGNIMGSYATMNVSGTALVSDGTSKDLGGSIYASTASTLNITGGTVTGGYAKDKGGNIYMSSTNTKVNISGGIIQNGYSYSPGGNIYHGNGKLTITGGIISGGKSESTGGNIQANMGYGNSASASGKLTICDDGDATTPLPQIIDGESKGNHGGNIYVAAAGNVNETGANTFVLGNCIISGGKAYGNGKDLYIAAITDLQILPEFDETIIAYIEDAMLPATTVGGQLDPNRASCTGAFTGKLVLENHNNPYIYAVDTGLFVTGAATRQDGGYIWYKSNDEAVSNYQEGMVLQAASGALTLQGGNYLVDIAGQTVAIEGSGTVTCFDSANDTYQFFGTATIDGPALVNQTFLNRDGNIYYTLCQDGAYSFHRIGIELVSVALRPSAAGIYYTGRWSCDETLRSHIEGFGVAVSLKDFPSADIKREDVLYTVFGAEDFASGVQKTGVMIADILKNGTQERNAMNGVYGQMAIFANAYVTVDGITYAGSSANLSLYDILKTVSDNLNQYYADGATLTEFMEQWGAKGLTGAPWDSLNFQVSQDVLALNNSYAALQPYYGELHDHAATGGTSDGKQTLDVWKSELNRLNMDFATIVDHRQSLHMYLEDWDNTIFIGGSEAACTVKDRTGVRLHYNMIFADPAGLEAVVSAFSEFNYRQWTEEDREGCGGQWHFDYPSFTAERFSEVCEAVYANGGFVALVHPKADGYIDSENPADAYFHDGTAIEVFYTYYANRDSSICKKNYKLWTDMLAAGYKVYASAGNDEHNMPSDKAVSVIYSAERSAASWVEQLRNGTFVAGGAGIRMTVGETLMGGTTAFAGQRLRLSVGDLHGSVYDATHTYRVDVITDAGVVYSQEISGSDTHYIALDADETAAFYRVELYDVTADSLVALGNPIWNEK